MVGRQQIRSNSRMYKSSFTYVVERLLLFVGGDDLQVLLNTMEEDERQNKDLSSREGAWIKLHDLFQGEVVNFVRCEEIGYMNLSFGIEGILTWGTAGMNRRQVRPLLTSLSISTATRTSLVFFSSKISSVVMLVCRCFEAVSRGGASRRRQQAYT